MAKVSRHFSMTCGSTPGIFWKGLRLCSHIPFNKVRNTHLNEKAYIVASGPTIKQLDIRKLKDKFTFGVNGSILKFEEGEVTPNYYVICDEGFVYDRPHILELILNDKDCHCFFSPEVISAVCTINPSLIKGHPKISVFHNHFKVYGVPALEYPDIAKMGREDPEIVTIDGRIGFSLNPEKGLFTAHTVSYFALQLAYGLGFRNINLIGMDLGALNGEVRFYEKGIKAMPSYLDRDYFNAILPSFEIVGELCKQNKLQVFNLSPISRLPEEVIPKKNFESAI